MFDVTIIKQEFKGLVGFRQPANPKFAILDDENLISKSGLYVTDNPYAKIEYIVANVDYERSTSLQINELLKRMLETSAVNICSQVFIEDDFVDRNQIYSNTQNKIDEFALPIGFVGYKIDIENNKNIAIRLNRIALEFVEEGTIDLLIYNTNKKQPIQTIPITFESYHDVKSLDIMLNELEFYKGSYYIGFINTGGIRAYKRNYYDSIQRNHIENLTIQNIYVSDHQILDIFNLDDSEDLAEYCGFNLDITVVDDYTDFIITNKFLFARAIYLDAIISAMNICAATLRSNSDERSANELYGRIITEIEGTRPDDNVITIKGLRPQMIYEISQIREQINKLKGGFSGRGYFVVTQD